MRALLVIGLAGCWTGPTPVPVTKPANAEIRAIRACSPTGPQRLIIKIPLPADDHFELAIDYRPSDPVPRVVIDGDRAAFSPCRLHGCEVANVMLDVLEIGKRAAGRYRITARAGMTYSGDFEARWVDIPWQVDCPLDPV